MVNIEAYTINEFVMYIFIMYVFLVAVIASSYMRNVVYDKRQTVHFWTTTAFAMWFGVVVFFDFRIGHIFAGIGFMGGMTAINTIDALTLYLSESEEQPQEEYVQYQEEVQPWYRE